MYRVCVCVRVFKYLTHSSAGNNFRKMKMKMEIVVLNILNFDIDKIFIVAIVCWCV